MARAAGFPHNEHLDTQVTTRGFRQMAQINRLPSDLGDRLIEHFGTLQALFGASTRSAGGRGSWREPGPGHSRRSGPAGRVGVHGARLAEQLRCRSSGPCLHDHPQLDRRYAIKACGGDIAPRLRGLAGEGAAGLGALPVPGEGPPHRAV